jgi:hypothetical protein
MALKKELHGEEWRKTHADVHQIFLRSSNQRFSSKNQKGRDHSEDLGADGKIL